MIKNKNNRMLLRYGDIWSIKVLFCLLLPVLLLANSFEAFGQKKRALIVAIGNYPLESKWKKINSNNDTLLLKQAFQKQNFDEITILSDEKATKQGILNQFDKLLKRSEVGDIILLHFSSHGQQIEDLNGDEVDGKDEAIVCYDAPKVREFGYLGERHLIDDELSDWIRKFRKKIGKEGDVLLVADACYSGSISRTFGVQSFRGGAAPLSLTGKELNPELTKEVFLSEGNEIDNNEDDFAPFVVISASAADQRNKEFISRDGTYYGSLTYAFNKVINNASSNETYRSLFKKIQSEMNVLVKGQTPEIEGLLDRKIWGGEIIDSQHYYGIRIVTSDKKEIEIDAGQIHGITPGSKIDLNPVGVYITEMDKPVYHGIVKEVNLFNSIVKFDEPLKGARYWAYLSEKAFRDVYTTVGFENFDQGPTLDYIRNGLSESPIIKIDANHPELIIEKSAENELILAKANSSFLLGNPIKISENGSDLDLIIQEIEKYTKSKFLLDFNPKSDGLNAHLEMIPSSSEHLKDTLGIKNFINNGTAHFPISQKFFLKIVNESDQRIYYNIVDIDAENNIAVVIPEESDFDGKDYWIEANSERIVSKNNKEINYEIYDPVGLETLKLFISDEALDLRSLNSQKSRNFTTNPLSDLERVFDFTGKMGTRTITDQSYSSKSKASSFTLNFQIVSVK